jgi:hypothetical protein
VAPTPYLYEELAMIRHRLVAGVACCTALVTLAACGSDTKSSSTTAGATVATSASAGSVAGPTASTSGTATTLTSATSGSTAGSSSDGSSGSSGADDTVSVPTLPAGSSADCKDLYEKFITAAGGKDGTAKMSDLFAAMKKIVPADLRDDVDVISAAFTTYQDALTRAGGDQTKALSDPEVQKALQSLGSADVQTASTNLNGWFEKTCPDLTDTTDATGATTG